MKRFLFTILLMALLVIFMDPAGNLISKLLHLDHPETYEVQEGDWLSKLALQYYGDTSYWKELALINRAPNGNIIFPGEKIIVPSFEAVQKIRKSRSLSSVNEVVGIQQDILAGKVEHHLEPLAVVKPTSDTEVESGFDETGNDTQKISDDSQTETLEYSAVDDASLGNNGEETSVFLSTPVLTALVFLGVILAIGLFMFYRNKKREDVTFYGESPEKEDTLQEGESKEKSIYFFEDLKDDNSDNGSKNKKKEVELVP